MQIIDTEVEIMSDYKKLYHKAFNAITDAEQLIETAATTLRIAQQECEDLYIESGTPLPDDED